MDIIETWASDFEEKSDRAIENRWVAYEVTEALVILPMNRANQSDQTKSN